MRTRRAQSAYILLIVALAAACGGGNERAQLRVKPAYPLDDVLRLNHVQVIGTHNSYHRRPSVEIPGAWTDYAHPPLAEQLDAGVRSIELDVANVPQFPVQHDPFVDDRSNCTPLATCLGELEEWSDAHPGHLPIFVLIEAKDPSFLFDPVRDEWDLRAFDRLDTVIRSAMGPDNLVTPDDVRGDALTLRNAVVHRGWPRLEDVRGKFVFVLNRIALRRLYVVGHPSLEGRPMFVPAYENAPSAAFIEHDQPSRSAIGDLVDKGFIVRTRADADGREVEAEDYRRSRAAIESGAQIVSTDYLVPDLSISEYQVVLPNDRPMRCNPLNAPTRCRSSDIENARGLRRPH
ncbi:MAG: hypothetical protein FJW86_08245 [Actinobacteria bacterium]|nr:hypothetical protein [Actinomycetota bacterium]